VTGPELDLLEHGNRGQPDCFDPGGRIDMAMSCENAHHRQHGSLRPWAGYIITGNADYVSGLALRAQFWARGIYRAGYCYERYYQLVSVEPRTTVWRSAR
jgi:hypothetical protein